MAAPPPSVWPWVLGVLAAALLMFVVIPRVFNTPVGSRPIVTATTATAGGVAGPDPVAVAAAEAAARERAEAAQMLNIQYAESTARPEIPEDYPRKRIGACPYAKAPSSALPLRDIPMCLVVTSDNMYLPGDAGSTGPLGVAAGACGARPRPPAAPAPPVPV